MHIFICINREILKSQLATQVVMNNSDEADGNDVVVVCCSFLQRAATCCSVSALTRYSSGSTQKR